MSLPGRVIVTAAHIAKGRRGSLNLCPLAIAVTEQSGHGAICVDAGFIRLMLDDGTSMVATLPPSASGWVREFDAGFPVRPMSFRAIWRAERQAGAA